MIPKYIKSINVYGGNIKRSIKNKIYNTSIQSPFSEYSWDEIIRTSPAKFKEATEEEYNKQEGIETSYQIY